MKVIKDPYDILGVAKDASASDVRKAYRRLVKKYHPDLNPGDAEAAERFKEVSAAYDLLGDPDKRARFDRGEIDATGAERPRWQRAHSGVGADGTVFRSGTTGFDDIEDLEDLADLFGGWFGPGRRPVRSKGRDRTFRMEIGFEEAVKGARRRVTLPDGSTLDLQIPEGVGDGQTLRLKGKGAPGVHGGPPGDALVEITVRPHPQFRRSGDDILVDLPISIDEAVLGGRIETPTVWGPVMLSVPKGSSSGQTLRIRGKGVRRQGGRSPGDQLVTLRIMAPPAIDAELEDFMRRWRAQHRHDPRASFKMAS